MCSVGSGENLNDDGKHDSKQGRGKQTIKSAGSAFSHSSVVEAGLCNLLLLF